MKKRFITISALCIAAVLCLLGQTPATTAQAPATPSTASSSAEDEEEDDDEEIEDDGTEEQEETTVDEDDREAREHPVIEYDEEIDIPIPGFIKVSTNRIQLNGADWSRLREAIKNSSRGAVSIVHIGDSHVQADIATGTTRDLLQYDYGDGGRGLITPLKMSGTNQPVDYTFSSESNWNSVKLMKHPWTRTMGFTGTSITPATSQSTLTVATSSRDDYDPFSSFLLFHKGRLTVTGITGDDGRPVAFKAIPSRDYTQVILAEPQTRANVAIDTSGDLTLFGAYLSGDRPGIVYNTIGNNGATYATYNSIGGIGTGIQPLHPDLVIISLGCNEAFGRLDTQAFTRNIDKLVKDIRQANPQAQLLLVTPMECHKSVYTTKSKKVKVPVKSKKRKGKRSRKSSRRTTTRTVTSKVKSYAVNNNIAPLRNEILRYGRDNNIAVYDWYTVAGGAGASNTWISNGYFSHDRVHHTSRGYHLQGRLLYEALIDEFGRRQ